MNDADAMPTSLQALAKAGALRNSGLVRNADRLLWALVVLGLGGLVGLNLGGKGNQDATALPDYARHEVAIDSIITGSIGSR